MNEGMDGFYRADRVPDMRTEQRGLEIQVVNCLSVDVEGFVESNRESFPIDNKYIDRKLENAEIEKNMAAIFQLLSECNVTATFFFLGRVARDLPHLVQQAASLGHEIASHNFEHRRIFGLDRLEFKEKLKASKDFLESLAGQPVYGFRAPDFSITKDSLWALDVLKELGFIYDTSIYPIGLHDVYGIKDIPCEIHRLPNGLVEFPLSTVEFLGRRLPFGGGGYFRIYPLFITHQAILAQNRKKQPSMFYIHPYEVGPVIPQIAELSPYRKFRHYYNCGTGYDRLRKLLTRHRFGPAMEVLKQQNFWEGN